MGEKKKKETREFILIFLWFVVKFTSSSHIVQSKKMLRGKNFFFDEFAKLHEKGTTAVPNHNHSVKQEKHIMHFA